MVFLVTSTVAGASTQAIPGRNPKNPAGRARRDRQEDRHLGARSEGHRSSVNAPGEPRHPMWTIAGPPVFKHHPSPTPSPGRQRRGGADLGERGQTTSTGWLTREQAGNAKAAPEQPSQRVSTPGDSIPARNWGRRISAESGLTRTRSPVAALLGPPRAHQPHAPRSATDSRHSRRAIQNGFGRGVGGLRRYPVRHAGQFDAGVGARAMRRGEVDAPTIDRDVVVAPDHRGRDVDLPDGFAQRVRHRAIPRKRTLQGTVGDDLFSEPVEIGIIPAGRAQYSLHRTAGEVGLG